MRRSDRSQLEVFGHGGDIWTAAAAFGSEAEQIIDLSANINPAGPPRFVMEELIAGMGRLERYPDPGHRLMKQRLADALGVESSHLIIGNGAAECMALLLLAEVPAKVGVADPCFSEYEQLAKQFGSEIERVIGQEGNQYKPSLDELIDLIQRTDLCFIGHPNNPTGALLDEWELERIVEAANNYNTVLAVDEAFIDYVEQLESRSALRLLNDNSQLVIIRSLTKFYAVPGLRLGYAITHPERIAKMTAKQVTWSVNGMALLAGETLFDPLYAGVRHQYECDTRQLVVDERSWLQEQLLRLGVKSWDSHANYLLCCVDELWTASSLQAELGKHGILIRSCSMYHGLDAGHFRVAVKDRESHRRLIDVLERILQG